MVVAQLGDALVGSPPAAPPQHEVHCRARPPDERQQQTSYFLNGEADEASRPGAFERRPSGFCGAAGPSLLGETIAPRQWPASARRLGTHGPPGTALCDGTCRCSCALHSQPAPPRPFPTRSTPPPASDCRQPSPWPRARYWRARALGNAPRRWGPRGGSCGTAANAPGAGMRVDPDERPVIQERALGAGSRGQARPLFGLQLGQRIRTADAVPDRLKTDGCCARRWSRAWA
jgi:hypothetical protein